jgi:hypothetical protein
MAKETNMNAAVQHIIDWRTHEAYFAVVRGTEIVKPLRDCRNWKEAAAAFRAWKKSQ